MYDPKVITDLRLASELSIKARNAHKFYSKQECDEQEAKFLNKTNASSQRIVTKINNTPNRFVDLRDYTRNEYVLMTANLDTPDRLVARNGLSLRVRAAVDPKDGQILGNIDMCLKTTMPSDTNVIQIHSQRGASSRRRGEWECSLNSLDPKIEELIAANIRSEPSLPDMILAGAVRNEELFVESIGCSVRGIYPSYEIINRHGLDMAAVNQHAQDMANIFMTPDAMFVTHEDIEEEFEFLGILGIEEGDITPRQFDKIMRKSMETLERIFLSADPGNVVVNHNTKSIRARMGLETRYGPPVVYDIDQNLSGTFNISHADRIDVAARHALSMQIRPADIDLNLVGKAIGYVKAKADRIPSLQGDILPETITRSFHI